MKEDIEHIQFGILSAEEIINFSVCEVKNSKMNGFESIYDSRMGVLGNKELCGSCNKNTKDCPGHFGHISLNIDILHPLYNKHILYILKCICFKCSRCLISKEQIVLNGIDKYSGITRFNKILDICENNDACYHCLGLNNKIQFNTNDNNYYVIHKNNGTIIKTVLSEIDIKSIFNNISDEDVRMLGLNPDHNHPRNFVLENLPVLPPVARPFVIVDNITCDDDLTIQYCEIIKLNNMLDDNKCTEAKKNKLIQSLKFRIKCLFDNSQEKAKHSNGRPMKGIKKRISGKEGQIRNHIMGKRVDKSARTVIGPDPTLKLDEIALPEKIANTLKYEERVHYLNINKMKELVDSGKVEYIIRDGNRINLKYAMFKKGTDLLYGDKIVKSCGKEIIVSHNNYDYILQIGDKLYRDDERIYNIEYKQKKNFNIQYGDIIERPLKDGDIVLLNRQPTLHRGSMLAQKIVIRPFKTIRMNLAITKTFNADFDGDEMNIHVPASEESNAELRNIVGTKWNMISPQSSKTNIAIVQDGLLGAYLITRENQTIGNSLFFQLTMKLVDIDVISKLEYIKKKMKGKELYTTYNLFSILLPNTLDYTRKNNCDIDEPIVVIKNGILKKGTINKTIIGSSHNSLIQVLHKEYNQDTSMNFVNNVQFLSYSYILYHGFTVGISDCISTKSSKIDNVITKCFVEAKGNEETINDPRIREVKVNASLSKGRDNGMKIAKDALRHDNNFISTVKSGSKGDYFNIAQITGLLGQQNLSGKRIPYTLNNNTRSLPHYPFKISDKKTEYESKGFIINSFIHGLNPKEFWFHSMTGREGITDTAMKTATSGYIQRRIIKLSEDLLINYDSTVRNSTKDIIQFQYGDDNLDACKTIIVDGVPQICDVFRLVNKLNKKYKKNILRELTNEEKIHILSVIKANNSLPIEIRKSVENGIKKNLLLQLNKIKIANNHITNKLKDEIEYYYNTSLIQPGESVGVITGESIGERQTQMTLNTFHSAGLAISTVLTGVPRFSELLNASKSPKASLCNIYFKEEFSVINDLREVITNQIRCIKFGDLIDNYEIDIDNNHEEWYYDYEILYEDSTYRDYNISLKIELNNEVMFNNFINTIYVIDKLKEYVPCIIFNRNKLVLFFQNEDDNDYPDYYFLNDIVIPELKNRVINGIDGINDFFYQKDQNNNWYVTTDGTNLQEILLLDIIDDNKTISNNMWEIYEIFGIEAVRQFLIDEFMSVVSSDGTYINERHVKLLVDVMTQHGIITSISRYGMKKDNSGPIAKASFEQSLDNFIKASFYSEEETLSSVSSNIMCGKKANIGTGMCTLIQDLSKL
jgi:DNA-directed RNA polymerase beta' subunit